MSTTTRAGGEQSLDYAVPGTGRPQQRSTLRLVTLIGLTVYGALQLILLVEVVPLWDERTLPGRLAYSAMDWWTIVAVAFQARNVPWINGAVAGFLGAGALACVLAGSLRRAVVLVARVYCAGCIALLALHLITFAYIVKHSPMSWPTTDGGGGGADFSWGIGIAVELLPCLIPLGLAVLLLLCDRRPRVRRGMRSRDTAAAGSGPERGA